MARLSSVTVELRANTAKFASGMERAKRKLRVFERSTNKTRAALTGLIGVGGSLAFTGLIKSSIDAGDNIQKLQKRLGGTTEFFSQMEHAAKLSGVQFNQFTMGIQRMTRRIAEAGVGTGEAKKAIDELGMSGKALSELSLEDQFYAVADALQKVENPADRVRLAMKFFDSEGVALVQMMGDGSKGLKEMAAEADALGITLDQKTANAMAKTNDELARAGSALKGATNQIATVMAPLIEEVAMNFAAASIESRGFSEEISTGMKGASRVVGAFADGIHGLKIIFKALELSAYGVLGAMQGWAGLVNKVIKPVGDSIVQFFLTPLKAALKVASIFSDEAKTALSALEDVSLPDKLLPEGDVSATIDRIREIRGELHTLAMQDLPSEMITQKLDEIIETAQSRIDKVAEQVAKKKSDVAGKVADGEGGNKGWDDLFGKGSLEGLFSDFDNIEENFKKLMTQMIAEATAASIVQTIFKGSETQGSAWGEFDWGGMIAGMFSTGTRAGGGPVSDGRPYMVGEMGPELFIPNTSGMVVPNAQTANHTASGGGQTVININGVKDADSFRKSKTQLMADMNMQVSKGKRNM